MAYAEQFSFSESISHAVAGFEQSFSTLLANVSSVVVAPEHTVRMALLGLFAQGHVLVEDRPGVGKTLLAKTIAESIEGEFTRVQFTPDLLPSDITGASIYNSTDHSFEFVPGPVFTNVLLADELNRTNPRTQAALLEAMAEGQVTADGVTHRLPEPFMVIATQNTLDSSGTFPLPDTELDRFLVRISIGLPSEEAEMEIILRSEHGNPEVRPVLHVDEVVAMQQVVRAVAVAQPVREYIVKLASSLRSHPSVRGGMSPRGTVQLLRAAQTWAATEGRDFATPGDVQTVVAAVLAHRIHVDDREAGAAEAIVLETVRRVAVPV
ncbi:MAG: MoxR family ATPase [Chloroflexi bacterium]|nr:MoxR family ATPase [Chloroflexota bacterium]MDA1175216.1 MoxR family ATPase [Chloroflexota bacterium]